MTQPSWLPDPEDPRAPPQEVWDRLTPEERERVVRALPSDMRLDQLMEARDAALRKAEDEARRAEGEARRAEEEARRATALESEVAELRATLERLRRER